MLCFLMNVGPKFKQGEISVTQKFQSCNRLHFFPVTPRQRNKTESVTVLKKSEKEPFGSFLTLGC